MLATVGQRTDKDAPTHKMEELPEVRRPLWPSLAM
jgi:hypothetical protein